MKEEKQFYINRYHPQRRLSKTNIKLYNAIIELDVETIFEFGCGVGRNLHALKSMGYTVRGMDINEKCVDKANEEYLYVDLGDEKDLKELHNYDLVFTNSVLCHMSDIKLALKEFKRIANKYIILNECVSNEASTWFKHKYPGKLLFTSKSDIGEIYNCYLIEV